MGPLVVHIAVRNARLADVRKCTGNVTTIGRGYGNDIVLTDPYIASAQLRVTSTESGWTLHILDNTNAVWVNGEVVTKASRSLTPGDRVTIGRTDVTFVSPDTQVESTRALVLARWGFPGRGGAIVAIALLLTVALFDVAIEYLQTSVTLEWADYAKAGAAMVVFTFGWSSAWALLGRLLRHQANFFLQVFGCSAVSGVASIVFLAPEYLEFWTNSKLTGAVAVYALTFVMLAALLNVNLFLATSLRRPRRIAVLASMVIVAGTVAARTLLDDGKNLAADYSDVMKPPFAALGSPLSIDEFIEAIPKVPSSDEG